MQTLPQLLLSIQECAQERRFEEERENSFHRESLPDHRSCVLGEDRPVCTKLELHRNSSHNTDDKIYSKNPRPKARRFIVVLLSSANGERFEYDNEQSQAHRQLRKQIVKGERKSELNPMNYESIHPSNRLTEKSARLDPWT